MEEVKLTKNELRQQERKLSQLERYLPTLQLKKAMLQSEIYEARAEIEEGQKQYQRLLTKVQEYASLFSRAVINWEEAAKVVDIKRRYENIAGVEVPYFESIAYADYAYPLFDTPPWVDSAIAGIRAAGEAKAYVMVAEEKKQALEQELRQVSIRVNLFERILIPRTKQHINKIRVFLGDQQLAAVSRAKVVKSKIEKNKEKSTEAKSGQCDVVDNGCA